MTHSSANNPNHNPEYTQIAAEAMKQMSENKGPGQVNGPKNGMTKATIANPNAPSRIHGQME